MALGDQYFAPGIGLVLRRKREVLRPQRDGFPGTSGHVVDRAEERLKVLPATTLCGDRAQESAGEPGVRDVAEVDFVRRGGSRPVDSKERVAVQECTFLDCVLERVAEDPTLAVRRVLGGRGPVQLPGERGERGPDVLWPGRLTDLQGVVRDPVKGLLRVLRESFGLTAR
ncbi:hypothetical protein ACWDQO_11195 [Streptomyces sp. NPDC003703]|uniref:hypothetical protein n=1 Tax=Streptomyces sp. NPDC003283 TaxID=3364681 RepID=UPI0036CDFBDC